VLGATSSSRRDENSMFSQHLLAHMLRDSKAAFRVVSKNAISLSGHDSGDVEENRVMTLFLNIPMLIRLHIFIKIPMACSAYGLCLK
jgi:hypothetical protein